MSVVAFVCVCAADGRVPGHWTTEGWKISRKKRAKDKLNEIGLRKIASKKKQNIGQGHGFFHL